MPPTPICEAGGEAHRLIELHQPYPFTTVREGGIQKGIIRLNKLGGIMREGLFGGERVRARPREADTKKGKDIKPGEWKARPCARRPGPCQENSPNKPAHLMHQPHRQVGSYSGCSTSRAENH